MAKKGGKDAATPVHPGDKPISRNRRATHSYELGDRVEAGLVLLGTEVKACRQGKANINDAYVLIRNNEAYLVNSHIAAYQQGGPYFNHDPERQRKLLLHRQELNKLVRKIQERGFLAVPVAIYFSRGKVKVEIAVAKGRSHQDKRQVVREREVTREMDRAIKRAKR